VADGDDGFCQTSEEPFEVRTWLRAPTFVRPVPPEVVGRGFVKLALVAVRAPVTDNAVFRVVATDVSACKTREAPPCNATVNVLAEGRVLCTYRRLPCS
jgi:hypothetical protein